MPQRAKKICVKCKQPYRGTGGYCETCKSKRPSAGWQRTQEEQAAHKARYGRNWPKLRAWVLAREPLCRMCQAAGRVTLAGTVDHITPLADGGTNHPSNLQPLCAACHRSKSAREGAQARNKGAGGRGVVNP